MSIRERLQEIFQKKNLQMPADDDAVISFDSLSFMMLLYEVETAFDIKFGIDDFDTDLTIARLIHLIESKL